MYFINYQNMAQLTFDDVKKDGLKFMPIRDFIKKYHKGLTPEAVSYQMEHNGIDSYRPNRERFVVLTEKTLSYVPRRSSTRP